MLKCLNMVSLICHCSFGGYFWLEKRRRALTAVSSKGDADIMVCKNVEKDRRQIVCMEIESEGQTKVQNEPCDKRHA